LNAAQASAVMIFVALVIAQNGAALEDDAALARLFEQSELLHLLANFIFVPAEEACGLCDRPAAGDFVS
jgi:hypothetical protein